MIRKQFYLHPVQNAALKRKAHSLGVSQAELMRRVLDAVLSKDIQVVAPKSLALEIVLENSLRLSKIYRLNQTDQIRRDDAYSSELRFTRWEQGDVPANPD